MLRAFPAPVPRLGVHARLGNRQGPSRALAARHLRAHLLPCPAAPRFTCRELRVSGKPLPERRNSQSIPNQGISRDPEKVCIVGD